MWAVRTINAVVKGTTCERCPASRIPQEGKALTPADFRPKDDPDIVERRAYYAELRSRYSGEQDTYRDDDGRIIVWTDGSCRPVGDEVKAGSGVFYGYANQRNTALPVRGSPSKATNNRAELQALLHVLQTDPRPLSVRTDSEYVANGATVHRLDWRTKAWFRSVTTALPITHAY